LIASSQIRIQELVLVQ